MTGVQSVLRGFALLEELARDNGPVGVTELVERTGLPYATVHRLMSTLVDAGYCHRTGADGRKYTLGAGLLRLGAATDRVLASWAQPHLDALAAACGETANLAVLEGSNVVYVAQAQAKRMVRTFTEIGNRMPVHVTAVGKVLLAARPREEAAALLRRARLPALTPRTITAIDDLMAQLDDIARRGYAVDDEEGETGVRCIAVPVPSPPSTANGSEPVAALSISGPANRLDADRQRDHLPKLLQTAQAMSPSAHPAPH